MNSKKHKKQTVRNISKNDIKLTISLLVSNRKNTIRKCLNSLTPILENIKSELIAVDTGSTDGSMDIVQEYTKKIVKFKWCNDFSAARNAGLNISKGEWFMYIDDDEWFEDVSEIIEFFKSGEYENYGTANHFIRNYLKSDGKEFVEGIISRLSLRTNEVKFKGKIHEFLCPIYTPTKQLNCFVHHYGYAFESDRERIIHAKRNIFPLLNELENDPNDIRNIMQLAAEYISIKEYDKAEELCIKGLKLPYEHCHPPFSEALKIFIVKANYRREEYKKTIEKGEDLLKNYSPSKLAAANIYIFITHSAIELNESDNVYKYFKKYINFINLYDRNPSLVEGQKISNLGDILTKNSLAKNIYDVSKYFHDCEKPEISFEFLNFIPFEAEKEALIPCINMLFKISCETKNYTVIKNILKTCGKDIPAILKYISQNSKAQFENENPNLTEALADINSDDPYILIQKILHAKNMKNTELAKNLIFEYLQKGYDCSVPNQDILCLSLNYDIEPKNLIENIALEDFIECTKHICKNLSMETLEILLNKIKKLISYNNPLKASIFTINARHQLIFKYMDVNKDFMNEFWKFCTDIHNYSHILYNESLFNEQDILNLPNINRFGFYMNEAERAYNKKHFESYISLLRKALKSYPEMSKAIKKIIQDFKFQNIKEPSEFDILAIKIKNETEALLSSGQKKEALNIINQLEKLMPNDADIKRLKKAAQ